MSKILLQSADALSQSFVPAERTQSEAAIGAAKSLVLALELRQMPAFQTGIGDPALQALSRGVDLSVQADVALREAHRLFARMLPRSVLASLDWGCTDTKCPEIPNGASVHPLRSAA
ncbi:hypothetical protein RZN05_03450 [Sphingomonas sp. HF-S4]|uniref:Uncharacterized protein n=1 Tax=Sphingomonas agrestis TaxID=3080540 RepID=A0ABU3Y3R3_9SPHN|nr:hypothetical protein [Sphingomonas sp. HF-S4]MDV3456024.1 hypothetical protein [Sphingomonas sp. HF-S4]